MNAAPGDAVEVDFDGLVGPTHNYAGLAFGNLASQRNRSLASNPREAALQGLAKMKYLHDLGLKQAVLPPHPRPNLDILRRAGFTGDDAALVRKARRDDPVLLAACYSASAMWAANAATVSPSPDTSDRRLHFTAANLVSQFHRSLEAPFTASVLRAIFSNDNHFAHHDPLPAGPLLCDEGAANHTRLCMTYDGPGLELFTFGRSTASQQTASRFPARQTREASAAIARLHQLNPDQTMFIQQHPDAIDAGVFHNDVVAVGNQNVLLYHAAAWLDSDQTVDELRRQFATCCHGELIAIKVNNEQLPLTEAIETYLFNSQLVTLPDGSMSLIAPIECLEHQRARSLVEQIIADDHNPICSAHYLDVRQSMRNGGGPACLRLRIALSEPQRCATLPNVFFTDDLHEQLKHCIMRCYRDRLAPDDLADPDLIAESLSASEELRRILGLVSL